MAMGLAEVGNGMLQGEPALFIGGCFVGALGLLWMRIADRLPRHHAGARAVLMVLSFIGLLSFPFGTILHGMALRVLAKTKHLFQ